jgi:hypothetical protein
MRAQHALSAAGPDKGDALGDLLGREAETFGEGERIRERRKTAREIIGAVIAPGLADEGDDLTSRPRSTRLAAWIDCEAEACNGALIGLEPSLDEGAPGREAPEVVAGACEHGVGGVAARVFEKVAAHSVLGFGAADDGFDRRAAAQIAFDGVGDAALLARDIDLEPIIGRRAVAAIAAVGDDARGWRRSAPPSQE